MSSTSEIPRYRRWRLPDWIDRALSIAVVPGDSEETQRTKRLLAAALWISLFTGSLSTYQIAITDAPLAVASLTAILVTTAVSLLAMWVRPSTYPGVMHFIALMSILVSSSLTILYGGFLQSGANAIWGFIAVLGAVAIFEDARSIIWLAFFIVTTVAASALAEIFPARYVLPDAEQRAVLNLLIVITFIFGVLYYYVRQRAVLLRQSDGLLRNILPDEIANRLKTSNEMIAEEFDSTSILFADVVGFTPMSSTMTPKELVSLLNEIFTEFDLLVAERGLEKIKTIGDAYMVAAGVPTPREDHAHAICDLALAMQEHSESHGEDGKEIRFRIGINSGPVMAGIIGRDKFSYDLWGDSVNVASRMESAGSPGRVQVTGATRALVDEEYAFEPGGTIDVKGKGPMEVWYLTGRKGLAPGRARSGDQREHHDDREILEEVKSDGGGERTSP